MFGKTARVWVLAGAALFAGTAAGQPVNDSCGKAQDIGLGATDFDTEGADTDGPDEPDCRFPGGNNLIRQDVWFRFTAPATGLYEVSLCNKAAFDTRLAVYADDCPVGPGEAIACNDDDLRCELFTSLLTFDAEQGRSYLIRLGGFNDAEGPGTLTIGEVAGQPSNDHCADAIPVDLNSVTRGTTSGATPDSAPECGTPVTAPGVWYRLIGNGREITVETCDEIVKFDTKLNVYRNGCQTLTCVGGDDDGCATQLSRLTFMSERGLAYLVLVQGFNGQVGDFNLTVRTFDGEDCNDNGVPDACDLSCDNEGCNAWPCGSYPDCNVNGILDECEGESLGPYEAQPNARIPDFDPNDPQVVMSTIHVDEGAGLGDVNVMVSLTHSFLGDLTIEVEHDGVGVLLWDRDCSSERDLSVVFDDEGKPLACASPTVGRFQPFAALRGYDGRGLAGDWTLTIADHAEGDDGTLLSWSINATSAARCDACTGREKISKADCKTRDGKVKAVVVKVKRATANADYVATLDTGESIVKAADSGGHVKFKFKGHAAPPCGPNGVSVCDRRLAFDCGC